MRPLLLDADAFLCLRKLGLLSLVCSAASRTEFLLVSGYVARTELSSVATQVSAMEASGCLEVQDVLVRTPAASRWKDFRRKGIHKGEAEAIAFALDADRHTRPVFISADNRAREAAAECRVPATDVMGFVVIAVGRGWLSRSDAENALSIWDDPAQEICRPRDYESFDRTFQRRSKSVEDYV